MRDRIKNFLKKYWLPLWCVLSALSFFGLYAAAEYSISSSTMKKVVASTSDQGKMFSSNILVENGNSTYVAKYFSTHEEDAQTHVIAPYDVDLYLWNYSLNNLSKWYPGEIDYNVTLTMTDSNGDQSKVTAAVMGSRTVKLIKVTETVTVDPETETKTITKNETELETLDGTTPRLTYTTAKQTLTQDSAKSSEDHYILRFSGNWNLDDDTEICVQAIAAPNNGGDANKYKDISSLSAIIGLRKTKGGDSTGWQAYIAEQSDGLTVSECDGYNLVATGSGAAKITIKWNTEKIACNRNFHNGSIYSFGSGEVAYFEPTGQSKIATLVISADTGSSDTSNRNRYDMQFYKTGSEPTDWNFFENVSSAESSPSGSTWMTVYIEQ